MSISAESQLYLDQARRDLPAAQSNLDLGFYHVTVSRAYYAMFYAASALLTSQGITRSKHSGVLSAFGEFFVKPGLIEVEFAKMLGHAFDSRLDSDYDVIHRVDAATAEMVLTEARSFVARVEHYFEELANRDTDSSG